MMKLSRYLTLLFVVLVLFAIFLFQNKHYGSTKHKHLHIASRKSNRSRPPYYIPKKLPIPSTPAGYPKSRSYKKSKSPPPRSPVGFPEDHSKVQIYNVLSFGAVGNGVKDDTQAFKNTWNAACQAQISTSSAVFLVPYKFSFMVQPIIFTGPCKSRLVFQIDGTLMPPDGPKQWPQNTNKQDWLLFKGVHGMLMQGTGLINGRGRNGGTSPASLTREEVVLVIAHLIGSLGKGNSKACVTNITVSDSTIKNSDNGVRIKTWQGGSGSVSEVTFKDIHMDIVLNPIIIDQFYCLSKKCPNQTSALMINSVHFSNIKGIYDSRKPPMHLACSDSMPCKNRTLLGTDLVPAQGGAYLDPFCWKAFGPKDTFSTRQVPCLMKGYPKMLQHDFDRSCF